MAHFFGCFWFVCASLRRRKGNYWKRKRVRENAEEDEEEYAEEDEEDEEENAEK